MVVIVHWITIIVSGVPTMDIINITITIIIDTLDAVLLSRVYPHNGSQVWVVVIDTSVDHCDHDFWTTCLQSPSLGRINVPVHRIV
jgi:hypothetical protein